MGLNKYTLLFSLLILLSVSAFAQSNMSYTLLESTDGGATWSKTDDTNFDGAEGRIVYVYPYSNDIYAIGTYEGAEGPIYHQHTFIKSADGGTNWVKVGYPYVNAPYKVERISDGRVFITGIGGMYEYEGTYPLTPFITGSVGPPPPNAWSDDVIDFDFVSSSLAYAIEDTKGFFVVQNADQDPPNITKDYKNHIPDPTLGFASKVTSIFAVNSSILLVTTYWDGLYRTTNGGNTWAVVNTSRTNDVDSIVQTADGDLFYNNYISTDNGATWNLIGESCVAMTGDLKRSDSEIVAYGNDLYCITPAEGQYELKKSTNKGANWQLVSFLPNELTRFYDLKVDEINGTIYVAGSSCIDSDGDGYLGTGYCAGFNYGAGPDCDDDNPAANPGVSEVCNNNKDDDCDGVIDCADSDCSADSFCQTSVVYQCGDRADSELVYCQDGDGGTCWCCDGTTITGAPTWKAPSSGCKGQIGPYPTCDVNTVVDCTAGSSSDCCSTQMGLSICRTAQSSYDCAKVCEDKDLDGYFETLLAPGEDSNVCQEYTAFWFWVICIENIIIREDVDWNAYCGMQADCDDNNSNIFPDNSNLYCNCDDTDGFSPSIEICDNLIDEDCSGLDEACPGTCVSDNICEPGCADDPDCIGACTPTTEICGNVVDEDCDGTDPACTGDCTPNGLCDPTCLTGDDTDCPACTPATQNIDCPDPMICNPESNTCTNPFCVPACGEGEICCADKTCTIGACALGNDPPYTEDGTCSIDESCNSPDCYDLQDSCQDGLLCDPATQACQTTTCTPTIEICGNVVDEDCDGTDPACTGDCTANSVCDPTCPTGDDPDCTGLCIADPPDNQCPIGCTDVTDPDCDSTGNLDDSDGDGYSDEYEILMGCVPDQGTEICDSGLDEECDGSIDCADIMDCPTGTECGAGRACVEGGTCETLETSPEDGRIPGDLPEGAEYECGNGVCEYWEAIYEDAWCEEDCIETMTVQSGDLIMELKVPVRVYPNPDGTYSAQNITVEIVVAAGATIDVEGALIGLEISGTSIDSGTISGGMATLSWQPEEEQLEENIFPLYFSASKDDQSVSTVRYVPKGEPFTRAVPELPQFLVFALFLVACVILFKAREKPGKV